MDLLQLWQNICVEARNLAAGIEQLPDHCESGDADAHLSGRCSHCGKHMPAGNAAGGLDCLEILSRLRADLAMLNQDMSTAVPALNIAATESKRMELRRGVFLAAGDLAEINEAYERISDAVAGFRRECTISRLRAVKRHCIEFRDRCERVNAELNKE
jgi:hypothetical protein